VFAQLVMGIYKVFVLSLLLNWFIASFTFFLPHAFLSMLNAKRNNITMIFVICIYAFLLQLSSFGCGTNIDGGPYLGTNKCAQ